MEINDRKTAAEFVRSWIGHGMRTDFYLRYAKEGQILAARLSRDPVERKRHMDAADVITKGIRD